MQFPKKTIYALNYLKSFCNCLHCLLLLFQTDDSEIDVDEDDEDDEEGEEEEEESKDLEDDSLEGPVSRGARPPRGGVRPPLLEESDNDFWMKNTQISICLLLYSDHLISSQKYTSMVVLCKHQ